MQLVHPGDLCGGGGWLESATRMREANEEASEDANENAIWGESLG